MATEAINGQALRVYLPEGLVLVAAGVGVGLTVLVFLVLPLPLVSVVPAAGVVALVLSPWIVPAKALVVPISKAASERVAIVFFIEVSVKYWG